jgi:hypothetical protein
MTEQQKKTDEDPIYWGFIGLLLSGEQTEKLPLFCAKLWQGMK